MWNAVEEIENRKDSQVAREIEVSIPIELALADKMEIVKNYALEKFVSKGMIADIAFHKLNSNNPHAHILLTMRDISTEGFLQKNRDWNDKSLLKNWRFNWAKKANSYLVKSGYSTRIDHRSLTDQGSKSKPSFHYGPTANAMVIKGKIPDRDIGSLINKLKKELKRVQLKIHNLLAPKSSNNHHKMNPTQSNKPSL